MNGISSRKPNEIPRSRAARYQIQISRLVRSKATRNQTQKGLNDLGKCALLLFVIFTTTYSPICLLYLLQNLCTTLNGLAEPGACIDYHYATNTGWQLIPQLE